MRLLFSAAALFAVACQPPPKRSQGRSGDLTIQQCRAVAIDEASRGRPDDGRPTTPTPPAPPPAQVRLGAITLAAGGSDDAKAAIQQVVTDALPRLRRCYEATLETVP